jgi:hypothetical protein
VSLYDRRGVRGDPLIPAYVRRTRGVSGGGANTWKITTSLGGFANVPILWDGASEDDAVTSFVEFLTDDHRVGQLDRWAVPVAGWRRIDVRFQGELKRLVFQSQWVASFSIERAR